MSTVEQAQWAQFIGIVLLLLAALALTTGFKRHVMRLRRDGTIMSDSDGWTLTLLNETLWLARFGEDWRRRYGSTWAFGYKREHVWLYTPKGAAKHGTDSDS